MARMHARRRGRSSSTKPFRTKKPEWLEVDRKEILDLILELYRKGLSTSQIGIELRDVHGIPDVKTALGTSMYDIIKEGGEKMDYPEDIMNLMRKAVRMHRHMSVNHKDVHNLRSLQLTEAKIRRLGRYYSKMGVLPDRWSYRLEKAKLIVAD
ncbi:MAG: 30S ribosomal protein S15 [Candidatus Thermoplasmatota archaeon]|nr:30S ribosomal protein S15 [Candidatus Thermoplasmatota archaeon]